MSDNDPKHVHGDLCVDDCDGCPCWCHGNSQPAPREGLTAEQRARLERKVKVSATIGPEIAAALAEIDAQANLIDALDRQIDGLESQRDALRSHMDEYHSDCYSKVQGDALKAENERLRAAVLDKDAAIRLLTATDDAGRAQANALRALVAEYERELIFFTQSITNHLRSKRLVCDSCEKTVDRVAALLEKGEKA